MAAKYTKIEYRIVMTLGEYMRVKKNLDTVLYKLSRGQGFGYKKDIFKKIRGHER